MSTTQNEILSSHLSVPPSDIECFGPTTMIWFRLYAFIRYRTLCAQRSRKLVHPSATRNVCQVPYVRPLLPVTPYAPPGDTGVADALLAAGASTDGHGAWQRTPLHIAAFEGHTSVVRTLLGAGADPWTMNGRGQTPTDVSNMYNANGEVLELLEQAVDMRRVISTGDRSILQHNMAPAK